MSRTPSQERLIAELQGRLGIQPEAEAAAGAAGASPEDWMTEGVVITVQPRGRRAEGQLVEKVAGRCPGLGQDQGRGHPGQRGAWCVGVLHPVAEREGPGSWGPGFSVPLLAGLVLPRLPHRSPSFLLPRWFSLPALPSP